MWNNSEKIEEWRIVSPHNTVCAWFRGFSIHVLSRRLLAYCAHGFTSREFSSKLWLNQFRTGLYHQANQTEILIIICKHIAGLTSVEHRNVISVHTHKSNRSFCSPFHSLGFFYQRKNWQVQIALLATHICKYFYLLCAQGVSIATTTKGEIWGLKVTSCIIILPVALPLWKPSAVLMYKCASLARYIMR